MIERFVLTSQELQRSGQTFKVDDGIEEPCYRDWAGRWWCGHDHEPELPLESCYQWLPGWTAQT
jgi:hypothetical protein